MATVAPGPKTLAPAAPVFGRRLSGLHGPAGRALAALDGRLVHALLEDVRAAEGGALWHLDACLLLSLRRGLLAFVPARDDEGSAKAAPPTKAAAAPWSSRPAQGDRSLPARAAAGAPGKSTGSPHAAAAGPGGTGSPTSHSGSGGPTRQDEPRIDVVLAESALAEIDRTLAILTDLDASFARQLERRLAYVGEALATWRALRGDSANRTEFKARVVELRKAAGRPSADEKTLAQSLALLWRDVAKALQGDDVLAGPSRLEAFLAALPR